MTTEPKPRDFIAPKSDADREARQWAAIERGLDGGTWASLRRVWSRFLRGDLIPGNPFYARPGFALAMVTLLVASGAFASIRWATHHGAAGPVASQNRSDADAAPLTLADGSTVRLERGTKLETPQNEPMTIVAELREGTADFEVVPNRQRSFTVVAGGVEVRVVGTAFRVVTDPASHRTTVTVDHGIVEVRAASLHGEVRRLVAGESFTTDSDSASAASLPSAPSSADPSASADAPSASAESSSGAPSSGAPSSGGTSPVDDAKSLYEAANRARRAGDVTRAATLYRELLRKHPDDARAQVAALELGRLEMEKGGDPGAAESALETASSASPGSSVHEDALARLVEVYAQKGDMTACKKAKAQYLATYPKGVHAAQVRSRCGSP